MRTGRGSGPAPAAPVAGRRGGKRRCTGVGTARACLAAVAFALAACAGQLPAPIDDRTGAATGAEPAPERQVPAPRTEAAAPRAPEAVASGTPEPPPPEKPAEGGPAVPEAGVPAVPAEGGSVVPESTDDAAGGTEASPTRLAALNPAVIDLLDAANRQSMAGRHDRAAATLERALRIEPGDAWLWHRLARTRLDQGKASLAEALAAKSNSLAAGDPRLQAQNWRLIAKARLRLGDASGAKSAQERAAGLQE